jgi:hypothetical protein
VDVIQNGVFLKYCKFKWKHADEPVDFCGMCHGQNVMEALDYPTISKDTFVFLGL